MLSNYSSTKTLFNLAFC